MGGSVMTTTKVTSGSTLATPSSSSKKAGVRVLTMPEDEDTEGGLRSFVYQKEETVLV